MPNDKPEILDLDTLMLLQSRNGADPGIALAPANSKGLECTSKDIYYVHWKSLYTGVFGSIGPIPRLAIADEIAARGNNLFPDIHHWVGVQHRLVRSTAI